MSIVIKLMLVALAAVFPKFKMGYGVLLIILMTFFPGLHSWRHT